MRIHIGSDHAGFDLKAAVSEHLRGHGHEVIDHGAHHLDPDDDYPAFCIAAAAATVADPGSLGIVIGGSGNGEQIAANKVSGVRAALAWSRETAQLAREHNDANVVAFGQRVIGVEVAREALQVFLKTDWEGGRHARRVEKLSKGCQK